MKRYFVSTALFILPFAIADSWGPPPKTWTSPDKRFVLERGDDYGARCSLTLKDMRGSDPVRLWTIKSPQTAAPISVYFSSDGRCVVLEDEHAHLGGGTTLAFIGPKGVVNGTYRLSQIIPAEELSRAPRTISSTWWKGWGPSFVRDRQNQFVLFSRVGTLRVFDLTTGKRLQPGLPELRKIREEAAKPWRSKLQSGHSKTRAEAARTLCAIRDQPSKPALIGLLDLDNTRGLAHEVISAFGDDTSPKIEEFILQARKKTDFDAWWALLPVGPKADAVVARITKVRPLWVRATSRKSVLERQRIISLMGG